MKKKKFLHNPFKGRVHGLWNSKMGGNQNNLKLLAIPGSASLGKKKKRELSSYIIRTQLL